MTQNDIDPTAILRSLLIQYDEALAIAPDAPLACDDIVIGAIEDAGLRQQFRRAQVCLHLLEQVRRSQVHPSDRHGHGDDSNAPTTEFHHTKGSRLSHADDDFATGGVDSLRPALRHIGRFRLIRRLGSGGFGVVFLADDPVLRRLVALKVPRPEALVTEDLRRRFIVESQIAARLTHSHLVAIYDAGHEDPVSYQVMAYCAGGSLASWLRSADSASGVTLQGKLSATDAAELLIGLADGVHYAHEHGILHRDLKPANVLLHPKAEWSLKDDAVTPGSVPLEKLCSVFQPMIADFGLARLFDDPSEPAQSRINSDGVVTPHTLMAGTPQYMAPEQIEGKVADFCPATDVYGLGTVLYEVLVGHPVFPRESIEVLRPKILGKSPTSLFRQHADVPRDLEAICLKCLSRHVSSRYSSARDLANDLRAFLRGEAVIARPWPWPERLWKWSKRRPAVAVLLSVSVCLLIGLLMLGTWHLQRLREFNQRLSETVKEREEQAEVARNAQRRSADLAWIARRRDYAANMMRAGDLFHGGQLSPLSNILQEFLPESAPTFDVDPRGFEWRYLWRQSANFFDLKGHTDTLCAAAMTPDGRACYSIARDGTIRRWDTASGRQLSSWMIGEPATKYDAVINADASRAIIARQLLVTGSWEVAAWDLSAGKELQRGEYPSHSLQSIAISPCGNWAAIGGRDESQHRAFLYFWHLETGESLLQEVLFDQDLSTTGVNAIAIAPQCGQIAVCLESLVGNQVLHHQLQVTDLTFAIPSNDGLQLPKTSEWEVLARSTGGQRTNLLFSPNGERLAFAATDPVRIEIWDWAEGRMVENLSSLPDAVDTMSFHATKNWLAVGIVFPESQNGNEATSRLKQPSGFSGPQLVYWDLDRNEVEPSFFPATQTVSCVQFHGHSGTWITGERGGRLSLWRPQPVAQHSDLNGHKPTEAWGLAFSPDSKTICTVGDDACVRLWNVETVQEIATGQKHSSLISCVVVSPNGQWIATGSYDHTIVLWDAHSLQVEVILRGHTDAVRSLAFSPDGNTLASAGRDRVIRLWRVPDGKACGLLRRDCGTIRGLAYGASGELIEGNADGTVATWYPNGSFEIVRVESEEVHSIALAPVSLKWPKIAVESPLTIPLIQSESMGNLVLYGRKGGTFKFVHRPTRLSWMERSYPGTDIRSVAFSPDGKTFAVAGDDRSVHLWHVASGQEVLTFRDLPATVNQVTFSPDGQYLAAALHDGSVRIWHGPEVAAR